MELRTKVRLYFDTETNGLLRDVSVVHCCSVIDVDTDEERLYEPHEIEDALSRLYEADEVIGHNIIGYDLPVLLKLHKWGPRPGAKVTDTLVIARTKCSNVKDTDVPLLGKGLPTKLYGRHSLKAWGWRMALEAGGASADTSKLKTEYDGGWDTYSPEMGAYCLQDSRVGVSLYKKLVGPSFNSKPFHKADGPFGLSPESNTSPL